MPAGKRQQSNTMLYTVITFVGLFVIATAVAVIFYIKFENQRRSAQEAQRNLEELATSAEWLNRGKIVGAKLSRQTYLGTMASHLDNMVSVIVGGPPEDTSAEVKVNEAQKQTMEALQTAQQVLDTEKIDPNTTGLVAVISKLKTKLDNTTDEKAALQKEYNDLNQSFNDAMAASLEKENELIAKKDESYQQAMEITQKYEELKQLMEQTAEERFQNLYTRLEEERANAKNLNQELLRTQAELEMTQGRMKHALDEVAEIKPPPDREAAAFKPDCKIILVDEQAGVVHLNIGADDHIYQGLTFSIYDGSSPIPKEGKGKAEVEVFAVGKNISAARIVHSQKKNPIAVDDLAANLIWDSDKTNTFVVAGEFDFDKDGTIDADAKEKITVVIEKWGGKVIDTVSVDTDFVILGQQPRVPPEPTFEDLEVDPMARDRYDAAVRRLNRYKEIESRAQALWIPALKYERFLDFIGYSGQLTASGAF